MSVLTMPAVGRHGHSAYYGMTYNRLRISKSKGERGIFEAPDADVKNEEMQPHGFPMKLHFF
jgi:hypothetical protein